MSAIALLLPPALLLTLVIPPLIFMLFATGSTAPGTAICDGVWIAVGVFGIRSGIRWGRCEWRRLGLVLLALALLFIHGMIIDMWIGSVNFARLMESCVILLIMLLAAYVIAARLLAATPRVLASTGHLAFVILSIFGFSALAGLPSFGGGEFAKPVIVFPEPSHLSFAYLPVLIFTVATASRGRQFLILGSALFLAVALQNLTMLVGIVGASCLALRRSQLLLLVGALVLAAVSLALDLSYYADRLLLSANSDNLSTLVYLQGWERAWLNINETYGLGVGFQQFGFVGSLGDVAAKILQLVGASLNLYDGGSTGSKLIAEFGAVGIVLILLYLRLVVRGVQLISRAQRIPVAQRDVRRIFFYSYIVAYASELFIRGNGYISPSATLLLVSLIAVKQLDVAERPATELALGPPLAGSA
jgi:hypothetical protein